MCNARATNPSLRAEKFEFEEEKQMRKLLPILQIIDLVLLLLSMYFHNDMLLIVAAVVIAVCVVLTFSNMKNKR